MEVIRMAGRPIAWVTRAPADYMLLFVDDPEWRALRRHLLKFRDADEAGDALRSARGGRSGGHRGAGLLHAPRGGRAHPRPVRGSLHLSAAWADRGTISFGAVGDGSGTRAETEQGGHQMTARIAVSHGGDSPRCYQLAKQCPVCGEFRGKIGVLPSGGVMIDTRPLSCRCEAIPCRYCGPGTVRRPLTEHFDPERRAGSMPWFGYLVPCGNCQAAGRGPRVQMSA